MCVAVQRNEQKWYQAMRFPNLNSRRLATLGKLAWAMLCLYGLALPQSAISQSSSTKQSDRLITHPETVKTLPSQNKRWALLIGVDRYEDSNISPLKGASNDARSLRDVLVSYAGFSQDQVIVISSDEPAERQPTRKNILRRLSNLSGLVPKDGLLLVSFAGHGIDRNGRGFLIPSDATFTEDVSLLEDTAISVSSIKQRIKDTGVQQVMIFLDACRSYPTGRSNSSNPLTPAFTKGFNFDVLNREVDAFAVLYATAVGSRAYEYGEKRQGYFSWAITQALSGAAANERGEVTLRALVKYLEDRVPKLVALDYGPKVVQKPFADIEGYRADELVISLKGSPSSTSHSSTQEATSINQTTPDSKTSAVKPPLPASTANRGVKAGKVLVLFAHSLPPPYEENAKFSSNLASPLLNMLVEKGLSVTDSLDTKIGVLEMSRLIRISGKLKVGDISAGRSLPFALVLQINFNVLELKPYAGLYVMEANGRIDAIDTRDGRTVAMENISTIRGFGNTRSQAKADVMRNVGEGVSESFINLVAEKAH